MKNNTSPALSHVFLCKVCCKSTVLQTPVDGISFLCHHVQVKCTLRMANATCIEHTRGQVLRTVDLFILQFYLHKSTVFLTWVRLYNVWLLVVNGLVGSARVAV
jgi:hypothetical protein